MKGKYHIVVQNNKLRYELDIRRNITIIRGDSATGKTKLIDMIEQAASLGEGSGVEVFCERPCRTLAGKDWALVLPNIRGQIIFLDEENRFVKSREFAAAVKGSDNYFVIVTREDLPNLPYSVDEIYGIHTSGKYHDIKQTYNELYRIYSAETYSGKESPEMLVVEDSTGEHHFRELDNQLTFDYYYGVSCEEGSEAYNGNPVATDIITYSSDDLLPTEQEMKDYAEKLGVTGRF